MKIIDRLENITQPFKNAVITIGNFDGVHIGHQALFHEVIEKADSIDGTSIAMTFDPHPIRVLKKKQQPPADHPAGAENRTHRTFRHASTHLHSFYQAICFAVG